MAASPLADRRRTSPASSSSTRWPSTRPFHREAAALVVGEPRPSATQLLAEHSVLLLDFYERIIRPGEALPHEALFVGCSGGTSIAAALSRELELVRTTSGGFRQADLVLVSDGIDEGTADAPALRDQAAALGVSVFGLAIGMPVEILAPWCDEAHAVTDLSTVEGRVASALFA